MISGKMNAAIWGLADGMAFSNSLTEKAQKVNKKASNRQKNKAASQARKRNRH